MKNFNTTATIIYESYRGYDHKDKSIYQVTARNEKSAENKARKLAKKMNGGRLQRGYIESVYSEEIK